MSSPAMIYTPLPYSTAKELSDSGVATAAFPFNYIACKPTAAAAEDDDNEAADEAQIPTIDFSLLSGRNPDNRAQIVRELGRACEEWGFFTVSNHGVPVELQKAMMDACAGFFDLTAEEKQDYMGRHVLDPIRFGTSFNSKVDDVQYWRDFLKVFQHPVFHYPTKPTIFREVLEGYSRHIRQLGKDLLNAIWESLGLEENDMQEALSLKSCFQILVANFYPPCPKPELALGLPAHSDHGLVTVLMQNGTDGLQVMHNGKWLGVKPLPNSFLVNIGDHMEIVTNGRYKSVLHRAKVNNKSTRISVVTVIGPSLDAVVVPAPILVESQKHPAAFRGIKYRDFMEHQQSNKLTGKSVLDLLRL
ncbi:protein DMR6-LIKE OXYGENASE 2-like [Dendrobium catenatum]|uniref:protein DMR6-LIKE OXYGENASE 2-like n=1 Tax=Dendrobium catenatum TaxID=906689 RepID=UPI0009F63237|nr:protein DMR6-LIKE OXYGENASE 2-like [Dendrobium catenatum]